MFPFDFELANRKKYLNSHLLQMLTFYWGTIDFSTTDLYQLISEKKGHKWQTDGRQSDKHPRFLDEFNMKRAHGGNDPYRTSVNWWPLLWRCHLGDVPMTAAVDTRTVFLAVVRNAKTCSKRVNKTLDRPTRRPTPEAEWKY